jgi:hypothetical protein
MVVIPLWEAESNSTGRIFQKPLAEIRDRVAKNSHTRLQEEGLSRKLCEVLDLQNL